MSEKTVKAIFTKAIEDEAFREALRTNPNEALKSYTDLTADESAALKALKPVVNGMAAAAHEDDEKPWYRPSSFKELGAAVLSVLLLIVLVIAVIATYGLLSVEPKTINIGDTVQVIDTFGRAKDLLNIFIPLISAVISFWLGVAVEGKRADNSEERAAEQEGLRETAQQNENSTMIEAVSTLAGARTRLAQI